MATRLELQSKLEDVLGSDHVYFQPPESIKMIYPCIEYHYAPGDSQFADNAPYIYRQRYQITVIDKNPDSLIPNKMAALSMCIADRWFSSDNLNHWVFNLYW